jgi:hypothetical protein
MRGRRPVSLDDPDSAEALESLVRLTADLKRAASTLTEGQARYLVDSYYQIQQFRIEAAGQHRAAAAATPAEPSEFTDWIKTNMARLEASIAAALNVYTDTHLPGRWAKSQRGIGAVLAAGLLAHIRAKSPDGQPYRTVGTLWRYAGLDPTQKWEKKRRRPWNARLKVICWKLGESFVKQSGHDECFYGKLYLARKAIEIERNEAGQYAEQAALMLREKDFGEDTIALAAYRSGKLPPAHLHARAKRYAVKLFLSHYHHVLYETEFGEAPPKPYVIAIEGHADYLAPPGWPMAT